MESLELLLAGSAKKSLSLFTTDTRTLMLGDHPAVEDDKLLIIFTTFIS
jgi:hypothetical protein